jgi:hypothetical protein
METKPHIYIATPMYGGTCTAGYTTSLIDLTHALKENGYEYTFQYVGNESLVTRARNDLTQFFLESNANIFFFIDADITFRAQDVIKMIEADKDILCGVYPLKHINWTKVREAVINNSYLPIASCDYVFNSVDVANRWIDFNTDKIVEVDNSGTGFMMIKRKVFEKLADKVPSYTNNSSFHGKETKEYFATSIDPIHNVLLSEDYHFCKLWTDLGEKIYVASWVQLKHTGTYTFG